MPEMTKKERVRAAVGGESVDRVPVGLWGHDYLRESGPRELVAQTVEAYRESDWDFVKFNPRAGYFAEAWGNVYGKPEAQQSPRMVSSIIESASDLGSVTVVDPHSGVFGDHLYALRLLADEIGEEVDIIHTIFSPMSVAALLCGPRTEFVELAREDPAAAHGAVQAVGDTLTEYAVGALTAGASGIFFAPLGWSSRDTCDDDFYREFGRPYDLQLLDAVRGAELNVLHVCRERNRIEMLEDYPVSTINWADKGDGNPPLAEVRQRTGRAVMGGVNHVKLGKASGDETAAEIRDAIASVPTGLLIGSSCSISPMVSAETKRGVVAAVRAVQPTS